MDLSDDIEVIGDAGKGTAIGDSGTGATTCGDMGTGIDIGDDSGIGVGDAGSGSDNNASMLLIAARTPTIKPADLTVEK